MPAFLQFTVNLPLGITFADRLAFIIGFLPPRHCQFQLGHFAEEVYFQRNQSKSSFRRTRIELLQFPLVHKELAFASRVVILDIALLIGRDVHIVVESNHSRNLGRVILEGEAEKNTGIPVAVGGLTKERVSWAPQAGIFTTDREIGDSVVAHQIVGRVGDLPLEAPLDGILRGLMRDGVKIPKNAKLAEVDPINDRTVCFVIRDRVRAIGGGVLEAIMLRFDPDV